jgi:hypothetical protein
MWYDVSGTNCAEKMMWVNVIRRAMFDFVLYKNKRQFEVRWKRAYAFIFESDEYAGLTFDQVCSLFGWNPGYIRRLIEKLDRSDIRRLESQRFKEEFRQDTEAVPPLTGPRWAASPAAVPIFTHLIYSRDYRPRISVRKVPEFGLDRVAPLVRWDAA